MEEMSIRQITLNHLFIFSTLLLLLFVGSRSVEAYKNYTVGDSLGWFDNLQKPNINYQKWVSDKEFSLGDFLIFNTDSNHSVVQTYNFTTYKRCDYDDAEEDDTTQWSAADPSAIAPVQVTVQIPLLKQGLTYFFSGDYDGDQCKKGQRFKINVTYGQGLPQNLKSPSTEVSPSPTKSSSGADDDGNEDDDSTPNPTTEVSSNFNNPKESSTDAKETSGSVSLAHQFLVDMKSVGMIMMLVLIAWDLFTVLAFEFLYS